MGEGQCADMVEGRARKHPSFTTSHGLSSDIFVGLFDWFLEHPVFQRWCSQDASFQLRCIGAPGSGKTTLAALVSNHIEKQHNDKAITLTIFMQQDVTSEVEAFLEAFYSALLQQIQQVGSKLEALQMTRREHPKDIPDSPDDSSVAYRTQILRGFLLAYVETLRNKCRLYLIFDGVERCNSALRIALQDELSALQSEGLSIFMTSRYTTFEEQEARCDHPNHGGAASEDGIDEDDLEVLDLYYVCANDNELMCFPCRDAGRVCKKCQSVDALEEIYEHINISITIIPDLYIRQYYRWNLETEHGNLNLGSAARKPPLSPLGRTLLSDKALDRPEKLVTDIAEEALGSIALAKARLDAVHRMETVQELDTRRDMLPPNVSSLFYAGLNHIEAQSPERRDMGVKVIAAVGRVFDGLSISHIEKMLAGTVPADLLTKEDFMEAAKGFLISVPEPDGHRLSAYHRDFVKFARDRYHVGIHRADSELTEHQRLPHDSKVRFEPLNMSDTPTAITSDKLRRTVTAVDIMEEPPAQAYVIRRGTRAWH